ncbi:hypothetical protein HK101_011359, partial [Irineochytrium annulatum]
VEAARVEIADLWGAMGRLEDLDARVERLKRGAEAGRSPSVEPAAAAANASSMKWESPGTLRPSKREQSVSSMSTYIPESSPAPMPMPAPASVAKSLSMSDDPMVLSSDGPAFDPAAAVTAADPIGPVMSAMTPQEHELMSEIGLLQQKLDAAERGRKRLFAELESLRVSRRDKNRRYKRLMAAACGVGADRVDELLKVSE